MNRYIILSIFLLTLLSNCATLDTVKEGKEAGIVIEYNTSFENAWEIAKSILNKYSSDRVEYDMHINFMSTPVYNGFIGVWVEKNGKTSINVTAYSRRTLATYISMDLSANDFHTQFKENLEKIQKD